MLNTIHNFTRKSTKYGNVPFISFLGAVLSRLAYFNDNHFLTKYNSIIGPVIQPRILQGINDVQSDNLTELLNDQTIYGLKKDTKEYEYEYEKNYYIDFISLNMPQNINIINGDSKGNTSFPVPGQVTNKRDVKYISIGWSNYGEIYIVADKRMPNTLFLLFRGTYSAKTASLYSKPTSLVPLTVCKDTQFLYGIFKPTTEMIHTIIEAMTYLASDFLGATKPNSVKLFTTGHSLGGAMCSIFAYLWMGIKQTPPYNAEPYSILAKNIVCVSLGAPRCMSSLVAKQFCNFVKQKKILFLRVTTRGDPVPGLPLKMGYQHPCSEDNQMRMEVTIDCNAQLIMRPIPNVNYKGDLDCQNYKTRAYMPNPLSHTIYLDILYIKAVDIVNFFKGIGIAQEVSRGPQKSTVCRIIMGGGGEDYKVVFFDVNASRESPNTIDVEQEVYVESSNTVRPIFGGKVSEDKRMTNQAFHTLLNQMSLLQGGDLCPQKGTIVNPFNNQIMPDLSCPNGKVGGKAKKNASIKKYPRWKKRVKKQVTKKNKTKRKRI